MLKTFDYIHLPQMLTPEELLLANGRPKTLAHVQAVSDECAALARRFQLDEGQCRLAGMLHDISAVIRPSDMLRWAEEHPLPLCEAERRHPFLLHQRLSAIVAREDFGVTDEAVLSAIACHTTLRAQASSIDMALFLADKIAWDQPGEPPYLDALSAALEQSMEAACLAYMKHTVESGRLLYPHTNWTRAMEWLTSR